MGSFKQGIIINLTMIKKNKRTAMEYSSKMSIVLRIKWKAKEEHTISVKTLIVLLLLPPPPPHLLHSINMNLLTMKMKHTKQHTATVMILIYPMKEEITNVCSISNYDTESMRENSNSI